VILYLCAMSINRASISALMYRMMQSNRQSKRGNSMSMLFPLLMASGSEAMSENPMLMMSILRGSNRQTY
jgi:hypothetical protein